VRPTLDLVGVQETVVAVIVDDGRDLPGQVHGVAHSGVEALACEGRHHVGSVAQQEAPSDPEGVGDDGVEPIDHRPLELVRVERAITADQAPYELEGRVVAGGGLAGFELELVATPSVETGDDHVRTVGVADVHPVALVVRVPEGVGHQPEVREAAAGHVDGEQLAHRAASAVAPEQELRLHRAGHAGRLPHGRDDRVFVLGHLDQLGAEPDVDALDGRQAIDQGAFEVGLCEGVLERMTVSPDLGPAGVEQRPAPAVVVVGPGARHDDRVDRLVETSHLERAQGLVVQADRLGLITGCPVLLDDGHP
jgi:hypothetical protein